MLFRFRTFFETFKFFFSCYLSICFFFLSVLIFNSQIIFFCMWLVVCSCAFSIEFLVNFFSLSFKVIFFVDGQSQQYLLNFYFFFQYLLIYLLKLYFQTCLRFFYGLFTPIYLCVFFPSHFCLLSQFLYLLV